MSKIKLSFSLILAIFLVGILSTAAFAKDPYGLKPAQSGLGLTVPFTGNSADPADVEGTKFLLVLKESGSTTWKGSYGPVALSSSLKGTFNIPAGDVTPGTVYTVELYHAGADGATTGSLLSKSSALVTDSHNTGMYQVPDTHVDVNGSGLKNANQTGYNNTRKQRTGQKVHGFYTNNTNSCASCHQTHTAADGESLLFKDGTYSTCSACHDGTTGAYNSFAPVSKETVSSIAGTFNVLTAGHNGSLHDADGSLQVSAAPGGNNNPDTTSGSIGASTWGAEFDCASCHAAHGSGSSTENNLNLDPMGWAQVAYSTATKDQQNGKLFKNLTINDSVPITFSTPYILVKKTLAASDISTDKTKYGYLYSRAGLTAGTKVIQTYRWDGKAYTADYSLWLRDKGHVSAPLSNADTFFLDASKADITKSLNVVWKDGFASGAAVDNVATAQIAIGVDVETTDDIASLFDSTNAKYVVDSGLQMSKYCSACHTDYLSTTRTNDTGTYTTAHRHKTAADNLTCVRCHFAHGSEAQIMSDANNQTYYEGSHAGDLSYYVDPNPSSALKRYTGMSACYACHGQGEQFLGNPNNVERPVSGQPGTTRGTNY